MWVFLCGFVVACCVQVNSDPETLAYSVMYLDEDGDGGEEDGQVAGLGEVKRNLAVEEWDTEAR